jgi:hypothetical protein
MAEIRLKQRSDTPAAVAENVVLYTDTSGNLNLRKPDGSILALAAAGNFTLTIPATGTVAMRNTVNTFSEAQTFSVNPIMSGARPAADGTAAFRLFKADGTTALLTADTTNGLINIPALSLDGTPITPGTVMLQPNGVTWTLRTSAADNDWLSVCYGNGRFVVVALSGTGNRVMTCGKALEATGR